MTSYQAQVAEIMDIFSGVEIVKFLKTTLKDKQKELRGLEYKYKRVKEKWEKKGYDEILIMFLEALYEAEMTRNYYQGKDKRDQITRRFTPVIESLRKDVTQLKLWINRYERREMPELPKFKKSVSFDEARMVPIEEVVKGYGIHLKKSNQQLKGCCPFHQESTPSFYVHPEKNFFKCWGCGMGGDTIKFVMGMEKCNALEAARLLTK